MNYFQERARQNATLMICLLSDQSLTFVKNCALLHWSLTIELYSEDGVGIMMLPVQYLRDHC